MAALVLATWQAWRPGAAPTGFHPTVIHLFVVGWITQLIFGVAHWMFPRATREQPRGRVALMWVAFVALNTGLVLRVLAEPGFVPTPGPALLLSALLQTVAATAFVVHIWPRIKAR